MFFVYVLQNNETKECYIGYTENLDDRIRKHNSPSKNFTGRREGEWILVYYEAFGSKKAAMRRESKPKSHGKGKQELLKRIFIS